MLRILLDPSCNPSTSNTASFVPGALDVIELTNNTANYVCSPSLWLALAGSGNSMVSATYAAVAAQLAPLTAAAITKASTTLVMPASQQQLEQSLVLPNAETVDINSRQHMLHALDYSGWLHGQLMTAAGMARRLECLIHAAAFSILCTLSRAS